MKSPDPSFIKEMGSSNLKKKEEYYLYDKVMQEWFLLIYFGRAIYKMIDILKREREKPLLVPGIPYLAGESEVDSMLEKVNCYVFLVVSKHFHLT